MSVGFGFSVGDFISALELVATVVDALRESGLARTEYRDLLKQVDLLKTTLEEVNNVELYNSQHREGVALRQAAAQCQGTIDEFWRKNIQKYQPSLGAGGSGSRLKNRWMMVKWALCRKEELAKFKADLLGHIESINLIMVTVQMAATRIDSKKNDEHHRTLAGKLQDLYSRGLCRMTELLGRVSTGIEQGKQLIEMTAKVIQTNIRIFQIVLNIQNIITRIPGQIDRQQPVYLIDAIGRHTPFHLEFITCAESLTSVLQNNFRSIGSGAIKIRRGEFAIEDSATKKDIDLTSTWVSCFYPGQQVAMSMVFNSSAEAFNMSCPKCREENGDDLVEDKDVECRKCKMVYRRTFSPTPPDPFRHLNATTAKDVKQLNLDRMDIYLRLSSPEDEEDEMDLYRRVRLKTSILHRRIESPTALNRRTLSPKVLVGWWICCCGREVSIDWAGVCPECGHEKCDNCDQNVVYFPLD